VPYEQLERGNWGDFRRLSIEQQLAYEITPPNGDLGHGL